jgi:L-ascorbate metabolism protein UlaG (beta-lactamase superfamily)
MRLCVLISFLGLALYLSVSAQDKDFEKDVFPTEKGDLEITFVGHGTLLIKFDDMNIHIDPVGRYADYSKMPKADLILITHEHGDHLDDKAISDIVTKETHLILTQKCVDSLSGELGCFVLGNGETHRMDRDIIIEAVPAYNMNTPFHPKGVGNGYILSLGGKRVYIAGDTENTPEMKALEDIDIAFLPMNLPYTMSPEMAAEAALAFKPKVLYPYHYGSTDTSKLVELLQGSGIDVRIRKLR